FFTSRRRHTRFKCDWSSDVCSSDLGHASTLAGPETKFVSVNNDTVYSIANVDTSGGPVRLDVPDSRTVPTGCPRLPEPSGRSCEIGRASCREREYAAGVIGRCAATV